MSDIVAYWAAYRAGDPTAIAALDHARCEAANLDRLETDKVAMKVALDAAHDHVGSAIAALKRGNTAGALHLLQHTLEHT